jgi:hypothetical protein
MARGALKRKCPGGMRNARLQQSFHIDILPLVDIDSSGAPLSRAVAISTNVPAPRNFKGVEERNVLHYLT